MNGRLKQEIFRCDWSDIMVQKPLRVLQINSGSKNFGGVSSFLYNIYTKIDRDVIQFDFLSPDQTTYEMHRQDIESMGGRIFAFGINGNMIQKKCRLYRRLKAFLKKEKYQIVHINSGNLFFTLFAGAAARSAGVTVRIIHSHNAGGTDNIIKRVLFKIMKPLNEKNATHFMACSKVAAEYMFTQKTVKSGKVNVIPNGIDTEKFTFSPEVRAEMRRELGVQDKIVVGNVARFMKQKNHHFLIEVFEQVNKLNKNSILMLVGQGELMDEIKALVHEKNLDDRVMFLGQRNDVERLYQAMDVFVLTSFHEGFPVTGIEVQCCGLPFVLSSSITREIRLTENTQFVGLHRSPDEWAKAIIRLSTAKREDCSKIIEQKGYSGVYAAEKLKNIYLEYLMK